MSNAKRVLDDARTLHLEICADAAVAEGPVVSSACDRDRGADVLSRAIEEQLVLPDLVAEIANAIGRSITAIIGAPKVNQRLLNSIVEHLQDAIRSDQERAKAASASPRLVALVLQQSTLLGADIAIRGLLDNELLRRMPRESHCADARMRKAAVGADDIGAAVRQLIGRHFALRLRDPRDPRIGQRMHIATVPPPFFESDGPPEQAAVSTPNAPAPPAQPSFVAAENGKPLSPRDIVLKHMNATKN